MLRTLGASSRQVLATVFTEAMVLGILASILGIVAGLGFVALVTTLFKAIGFELPQSGIVITPASVIVPMIVGIVATLGSSIVPALRATRVTPLEALREGAGTPEPPSRRRIWIARALVVIGIVALAGGLFATSSFGSALPLLGLGLILLFIGVAMLAGTLIAPLASLVGKPIERLRGVTGRLARENTLRNPSRTATTSAALMIGVALVVFAAVFASSATKSVGDALDETFAGDLIDLQHRRLLADLARHRPPGGEGRRGRDGLTDLRRAGRGRASTRSKTLITGLDPGTLTKVAEARLGRRDRTRR